LRRRATAAFDQLREILARGTLEERRNLVRPYVEPRGQPMVREVPPDRLQQGAQTASDATATSMQDLAVKDIDLFERLNGMVRYIRKEVEAYEASRRVEPA
jgi:hypothetical protein